MLDYIIKRPLLLSGIFCCFISVLAFYSSVAVVYLAAVLCFLIGILIYFKADARIIFTSVLIFAMCISTILSIKRIDSLKPHIGTKQRMQLTVCEVTYKSDEFYIATAQVMKSDRIRTGTKISVFYEPQNIKVGDRLECDIKLGEIDDGYLKRNSYSKGIFLRGNLSDITVIEGKNDILLYGAESIRNYIKTTLMKHMNYEEAATFCALIFGERGYFTDSFAEDVLASGLSHVMVVSGMHMAILVSLFTKLTEKLFYNRFVKAFVMILSVMGMSLLCGFTMSVLRAGITYILMALGIMLDRKGRPENTLGGALVIILLSSPFAIFSVSLQLSLLSTFGILVVALPMNERLKSNEKLNKFFRVIITSANFSFSAMLLTMPVIIYVFGYISTVSVISNLLVSTVLSVALSLVIVALILNPIIPLVSGVIFIAAELLAKYINTVIEYMGNLSFAVKTVPKFWGYIAILMIFFVLTVLLACKKRNDVLKLKEMNEKIIREGGGKLKWHR